MNMTYQESWISTIDHITAFVIPYGNFGIKTVVLFLFVSKSLSVTLCYHPCHGLEKTHTENDSHSFISDSQQSVGGEKESWRKGEAIVSQHSGSSLNSSSCLRIEL